LERAEAVATAQVAGRGRASAAEQQEARDLIKDMLSRGGEIQVSLKHEILIHVFIFLWHHVAPREAIGKD